MMGRPFESRMAEIDVEFRNFGEELSALGKALAAIGCPVDAVSKWQAIVARRQGLMVDFAMLRADVRRA